MIAYCNLSAVDGRRFEAFFWHWARSAHNPSWTLEGPLNVAGAPVCDPLAFKCALSWNAARLKLTRRPPSAAQDPLCGGGRISASDPERTLVGDGHQVVCSCYTAPNSASQSRRLIRYSKVLQAKISDAAATTSGMTANSRAFQTLKSGSER